MENNFEKQEGIKFSLPIKKAIIIVAALIVIISLGLNIYQMWWVKYKGGVYQQGFNDGYRQGSAEVINWEVGQLQLLGGFGLVVPTVEGGTTTVNVVLAPQN